MQKFNYQFEADWIVNAMCNFSCDYCDATNSPAGTLYYPIEKYVNFFKKRGQWMLHISGGEPLLYMKNVDLMKALTESGQYISLNTNLSQENRVMAFVATVNPEMVEYVHVGIHPKERDRMGWLPLMRNLCRVRDAGFELFASIVMTPSVFGFDYELARAKLSEIGITVIPKAMRSDFGMRTEALKGTNYPSQYSDAEKKLFTQYAEHAAKKRPDLLTSSNTINPMVDVKYLTQGFPDFKASGTLCSAGRNFFKIDELGKIWRCERIRQCGDIGLDWLSVDHENKPCNEQFCIYYCIKYASGTSESNSNQLCIIKQ